MNTQEFLQELSEPEQHILVQCLIRKFKPIKNSAKYKMRELGHDQLNDFVTLQNVLDRPDAFFDIIHKLSKTHYKRSEECYKLIIKRALRYFFFLYEDANLFPDWARNKEDRKKAFELEFYPGVFTKSSLSEVNEHSQEDFTEASQSCEQNESLKQQEILAKHSETSQLLSKKPTNKR